MLQANMCEEGTVKNSLTRIYYGYTLGCMKTTLQKWGNSQGIRIPKEYLESLNLHVGDSVDVKVASGRLEVCATSKPIRGRYRIENLAARMPKKYRPQEVKWGYPVGKEVW